MSNNNLIENIIDGSSGSSITQADIDKSIQINNERILRPNDGYVSPLYDYTKKDTGYGKAGVSTYFQPLNGLNQSLFLGKIDYSKIWVIHAQSNSRFVNLAIHEDIIANILNKDISKMKDFCLILDPKISYGAIGKFNQIAETGNKISFNGDIIPSTEDANNPTKWVNNNGEVTSEYKNIKNVTYTRGSFVNSSTTSIAIRGDISCDLSNNTSVIVKDDTSKYFVISSIAGGGTFAVLKLFPFYVSRSGTTFDDYGSYFFENNGDAIGKLLEIIYADTEVNNTERTNNQQLEVQSLFAFNNQDILINNLKVG